MKINKFALSILLSSIFIFIFCLFPKPTLAVVLFKDNFNDGDAQGWEVVGDSGWNVVNGEYGNHLNPGVSNSIPNDSNWNNNLSYDWNNYIFKVDLRGVVGTDKNLVFKFIDNLNFYSIHNSYGKMYFEKYINNVPYLLVNPLDYPLDNGVTYHFKLIVDGDHFRLFESNNLLFDVIDGSGPKISGGKIGLRIGTGGDPSAEVWFDNVMVCSLDDPCEETTPTSTPTPILPDPTATPTLILPLPTLTPTLTPAPILPTPTPLQPVVFLPGLGGSINFKEMFLGISDANGWKMTPGANVYNNFLKAFKNNPDFYVFYYDWRKPVLENAQKLNYFIKNTIKPWNNKVDLVGHSLGGFVSRVCIQKTADNCYADKLITLGSPHLGSVDAYLSLEGGEVPRSGLFKLGLEILIHYNQRPGETQSETVRRIAPVLYDLLPGFDYVYRNGALVSKDTLSMKNGLLPQLSDLSKLENITTTIYGNSFATLNSLTVTDAGFLDKLLGNWPDGKPTTRENTTEGDGMVLSKSAKITNSNIDTFSFNLKHDALASNGTSLQKLFDILGRSLPPGTYNSLEEEENYLVFYVHSPVQISSPDLNAGDYISDEMIIIANPQNKEYSLNINGLKNDFYSLSVGQIFGNKVNWNDYYDEAKTGVSRTLKFNINPQGINENPLVDTSGNNTKGQLSSRIKEFKKEINDLNLGSKYKRFLLEFLEKIERERNPEQGLLFTSILRQKLSSYRFQKVLSTETIQIFRAKTNELTNYFEYLALLKPRKISRQLAQVTIKVSEITRDNVFKKISDKFSALIFTEALEKLDKAKTAFNKGDYYRSFLHSSGATSLFFEAKN